MKNHKIVASDYLNHTLYSVLACSSGKVESKSLEVSIAMFSKDTIYIVKNCKANKVAEYVNFFEAVEAYNNI